MYKITKDLVLEDNFLENLWVLIFYLILSR